MRWTAFQTASSLLCTVCRCPVIPRPRAPPVNYFKSSSERYTEVYVRGRTHPWTPVLATGEIPIRLWISALYLNIGPSLYIGLQGGTLLANDVRGLADIRWLTVDWRHCLWELLHAYVWMIAFLEVWVFVPRIHSFILYSVSSYAQWNYLMIKYCKCGSRQRCSTPTIKLYLCLL